MVQLSKLYRVVYDILGHVLGLRIIRVWAYILALSRVGIDLGFLAYLMY